MTPVTELSTDDRKQRLKADVVTYNTISAVHALERISLTLAEIYRIYSYTGLISPSEPQLSQVFSDAWSIVDSLHQVRLAMKVKDNSDASNPYRNNFAIFSEIAYRLRNNKQHIDGQLVNYSTKKEPMHPLYGIVTAIFWGPELLGERCKNSIHNLILSHSEFHHPINFEAFPPNDELFPLRSGITHVTLHAFDKRLRLNVAVDALVQFTNAMAQYQANPPNHDRRLRLVAIQTFDEDFRTIPL